MTAVARVDVLVALGVVELPDAGENYLIARRLRAVIDLGANDLQIRRTVGRQILDREDRPALVVLLGREAHCKAVAMGVLEVPVDPAAALARQIRGKLAGRQHHLAIDAVDPIAIDVNIAERVVRADLLELTKGLAQRAMIPDAD